MRRAKILVNRVFAGILEEIEKEKSYRFVYNQDYKGIPVSLTMPLEKQEYLFSSFPPFFDGLLPEGWQLESLLKEVKIDRDDYFSQLLTVGKDVVGVVTIENYE